jgi:hypothetical protein
MQDTLWYLIRLPVKFYVITWTYVLLLFKRKVPKWLQEDIKQELETEIPLGKYEKYTK